MNKTFFAIFLTLVLSGCVETIVVGTVATGAYVASDSNVTIIDKDKDSKIKLIVEKSFKIEEEPKEYKYINVKVYNGRVMLTGYVKDEKYKKIAVNKSNAILGDGSTIDEILVVKNGSISSVNDSMISAQISLKLRFAKDINTSHYRYNVVDGVVYILGESNDPSEIARTTKILSEVRGVEKVITYIKLV